ncbi:unnamed protein product, partial [Prorocentrum cordatum]
VGGKQGGVDTPDLFNSMVESALEPVIQSWRVRHFGFPFGDEGEQGGYLNHLIWADNFIILAADIDQFESMAQELTSAMESIEFTWKESSLEVMACGALAEESIRAPAVRQTGKSESLLFAVVDHIVLLGAHINSKSETAAALEHRLAKAEAHYWAHVGAFRGGGTIKSKLKAWCTGPSASVLLGSCAWQVSQSLLHKLKVWEWHFLRRAFRLRRKPGEGAMAANVRTSALIKRWMHVHNVKPLHIRVLRSVFKHAWREKTFPGHGGHNYLAMSRSFRSREWWEHFKYFGEYRKRRRLNMLHSSGGQFSHREDVFCEYFGVDWREVSCEASCKRPRVQKYRVEDLPARHEKDGVDEDVIVWDTRAKRFVTVCDCQPLVDVVMGRNLPAGSGNAAVFEKIYGQVASLFDNGWLPYQSHQDPVLWRNRNHNAKADHIANVTLNAGKSWHQEYPLPPGRLLCDAVVVTHCDGGRRGPGSTAAAWIVEAMWPDDTLQVIALSGAHLDDAAATSSFDAEAL